MNNFNDLVHRAILHALLCYDLHNFHAFFHNSFRSPLLRNHLDPLAYLPSVLLAIVNVSLLDHFIRFFIRELLTHIFLHVALILCKIWDSRLNSLSERMDNFFLGKTASSLWVVALSSPLSFNFARCSTTADNSVFTFVSFFSGVLSCALDCSCVQLLDRCFLICHLLGR